MGAIQRFAMLRPWHLALAAALALLDGAGAQNQWTNLNSRGQRLDFVGDPSPGLTQRRCYSYYGDQATRSGKEWATTECNAPFDFVCILLKGEAEITDYNFRMSYVRGCHFTCPCPEEQPWEEWYMGPRDESLRATHHNLAGPLDEPFRYGVLNRHWEKSCFLQAPPTSYAVASKVLPFARHKPLEVRCCKKHWDWIGHENDTKKHPRFPTFRKDVNRSVDVRIGWWGNEKPLAQPPVYYDENDVRWSAENCNNWPDEDPMTPWDQTAFYIDSDEVQGPYRGLNAGSRSAHIGWLAGFALLLPFLMR